MKNIIKTDYDQKYINYIKSLIEKPETIDAALANQFITLLEKGDLKKRKDLWDKLTVNVNKVSHIPLLANPYFIGFGNPDAEILFLGREKGFNIHSNPEGFFQESINNTLQWKLIFKNELKNTVGMDPRNPRLLYKDSIKKVHTWGKYAQVIAGLYNINWDGLIKNYDGIQENSLFDLCFMSEINHIPSRYSQGVVLNDQRMELLQNPFFRKFKYVIIGAMGYLTEEGIKKMFGISQSKTTVVLDEIGRDKDKEFTADIFKTDTQTIVYCRQLSGASGWSNIAINNLVDILKKEGQK